MAKAKNRNIILPIAIIICVVVIISAIVILVSIFSGNYINYSNQEDKAYEKTAKDAVDSTPIIVNGILLGCTKNNEWINSDAYYEANSNIASIDINMFSENKFYGEYKTASLKKHSNKVVYTTIAKEGVPDKYLALGKDSSKLMPGMTKVDATEEDLEYVKEALGSYKLVNGSVKITEVYLTNITNVTDKVICVVSEKANMFGAYSAVIFVKNKTPELVKYSYVKDVENADRWPVYSLQFVKDLNMDNKPEIILQELTGNDVKYSVLEYKDNKFVQVLSTAIEI